MTTKSKKTVKEQVMVEGVMTFGMLKNGLRMADFMCCEDAELDPLVAQFKVQIMRDGNVYMMELPKRVRNKSIFREDNSSLSLGKNGRYYFVFTMEEERLGELPSELIRQASAIAQKVVKRGFVNTKKEGGNE
jgi:hypothetical protein